MLCGIATALILKIIAFCKKHNLDERWIMCAKFGTIVMVNNYLAMGGRDLWITLYSNGESSIIFLFELIRNIPKIKVDLSLMCSVFLIWYRKTFAARTSKEKKPSARDKSDIHPKTDWISEGSIY